MSANDNQKAAAVVREVASLQIKLLIDALRDLVLSPITLGAALLDLLLIQKQPPRYFHLALRLGKRSDEWIDLWSPIEQRDGPAPENVDAMLTRVEELIRDPRTGAQHALVLKRWMEMTIARQRRAANAGTALPPPPPPPGDPV